MKLTYEDFVLKSRQAKNLKELCSIFESTLQSYSFNNWAYQVINASHETDKRPVIFANYPEEWVTHYIEQGYNRIDPVILSGPSQLSPFLWRDLDQHNSLTLDQLKFYREAEDYGLPDGLGIPVHGGNGAYAMVSMASSISLHELKSFLKENITELHLISLVFHTVARDLISLDKITGSYIDLTLREKECLTWVAAGKTAWETAVIMKITESTIKYFLANARTKLGVYSTKEAVIKAFMLGLIRP